MAATRQTVRAAAGAEQPAVAARWWVVVPYRPVIDDSREQLRASWAGARGRTLWETHLEAAIESQRLADQVDAVLRRAGIDTWLLDGTQALALLWERLHPAAELTEPEQKQLLERLAGTCEIAAATTARGGRRAAPPDARGDLRAPGGGDRHRRAPGVAAPRRRDAGGDDPSRDPAAGDRPVVAGAPAQLPAARDARRSHQGRCPLAREAPPASSLAAAAGRGPLQGAPRPARRLAMKRTRWRRRR